MIFLFSKILQKYFLIKIVLSSNSICTQKLITFKDLRTNFVDLLIQCTDAKTKRQKKKYIYIYTKHFFVHFLLHINRM